jgi:hypothetical protein
MKPWNFLMGWPEILSFFLLVIGFFIALGAGSAVIAYTLILLGGFMGGRTWFRIKPKMKIAWSIVLMGYLVGFMLGARYGDSLIFLVFYITGICISYYLHDKGIIKSLEF